jgi:hypothetical protein
MAKQMEQRRPGDSDPPYGPNIVRAWFDSILQGLRALRTESNHLVVNDWTWRFRPPRLERLASFRNHLSSAARENLEQFLSFFAQVDPLIRRHDERVRSLFDACQRLLSALVASASFREVYHQIASDCEATLGRPIDAYFGAYNSEDDYLNVLTEYLVNNTGDLGPHYATAALWNRYRERLKAVIELDPELNTRNGIVLGAGRALSDAVRELDAELRRIREELSLRFDVPLAPEVASPV